MTLKTALQNSAQALNIALTDTQSDHLLQYLHLLHKWNQAYNLTAVRDINEMLDRHIIDSLTVLPYLHGHRHCDVGTGAGLPGVPLAIMRPEDEFILVDSNGKKTRFLTQVIYELQLQNITIVNQRIETYQHEPFDTIMSRAFASLADMVDVTRHLCGPSTIIIAMKSGHVATELPALESDWNFEIHEIKADKQSPARTLVILQCVK